MEENDDESCADGDTDCAFANDDAQSPENSTTPAMAAEIPVIPMFSFGLVNLIQTTGYCLPSMGRKSHHSLVNLTIKKPRISRESSPHGQSGEHFYRPILAEWPNLIRGHYLDTSSSRDMVRSVFIGIVTVSRSGSTRSACRMISRKVYSVSINTTSRAQHRSVP